MWKIFAPVMMTVMLGPVGQTAFAADVAKPSAPAATSGATFTNKLVDGKKTWLPLTVTLPSGKDSTLTLVNTLTEPHGFEVPGIISPVVVGSGETKTVVLKAPKAGHYKIKCQLHPAHVAGEITVQ